MRRAFEVDEANTYVRLYNYDKDMEKSLRSFSLRNLSKWAKVPGEQFGTHKWAISHVFATFSPDKSEYRISKGFYGKLKEYLKGQGYDVENIIPNKVKEITPAMVEHKWKKGLNIQPRNDEQRDYVEFTIREDKPIVVINGRTGFGKSLVSTMAFFELGYRVVITVLPRYVPVWTKTFKDFVDIKPGDIINVSDWDINDLYDKLKTGKINPKIIIFQLTRIDTYIKRMRELPGDIPHLDDFFEVLGGGMRLIDETHESIYSVYNSMLYGNFKKNVGLSATLQGDDEFINEVYRAVYPDTAYLKPPTYDKYIHVVAYMHRINMNKYRIRTKGFGGYSHMLYEKGILKNKVAFENYYQVCKQAFEEYYVSGYREGQKALWFFFLVDFCKAFEERLKKDYPEMDIFTFTGEISKKKGMEQEYNNHQVVITTPGSCATGKDIPYLFTVFACVSVSSSQKNDQMNGRLRPIDKWWPDLDPIFVYLVGLDEPKQVEYHKKRRQVLAKKTKKFSIVDSNLWV